MLSKGAIRSIRRHFTGCSRSMSALTRTRDFSVMVMAVTRGICSSICRSSGTVRVSSTLTSRRIGILSATSRVRSIWVGLTMLICADSGKVCRTVMVVSIEALPSSFMASDMCRKRSDATKRTPSSAPSVVRLRTIAATARRTTGAVVFMREQRRVPLLCAGSLHIRSPGRSQPPIRNPRRRWPNRRAPPGCGSQY